jgi:ribosomal protein S18 acetylase RimI-like enzyme
MIMPAEKTAADENNTTHAVAPMAILEYGKCHEDELLQLLATEPDWGDFLAEGALERFKMALASSATFVCQSNNRICGYIRAIVDGFGIYVSELYVAPPFRNRGFGGELLRRIGYEYRQADVYVLSDADKYYEKLGLKKIGSVFRL